MTKRRAVLEVAATVAGGLALGGCSTAASADWGQPHPTSGSASSSGGGGTGGSGSPTPAPVAIRVVPDDGAAGVSVVNPVRVTVASGTLTAVSVSTNGQSVSGALSADGLGWSSTAALRYGQTYTVTASTADGGSRRTTFTTVAPTRLVSATFQVNALGVLKDGGTYGVGQPITVAFSKAPTDKAAAVNALDLTIEPGVEVRWHWLDDSTVAARPEQYWAAGTKITVKANVFGVSLGGGAYGRSNNSVSITIGPEHVAVADSNTHHMLVYVDGKLTKDMPCSMGRGGTTTGSKGEKIQFWTYSGTYVVLEKDATVQMTSASYGITDKNSPDYYDESVSLCCRISYSGEYTHSAPWSVSQQGHSNVSHGCINLSPDNARWIFDNFQVGDIVKVVNTPKSLPLWDGVTCWNIPWSQW